MFCSSGGGGIGGEGEKIVPSFLSSLLLRFGQKKALRNSTINEINITINNVSYA